MNGTSIKEDVRREKSDERAVKSLIPAVLSCLKETSQDDIFPSDLLRVLWRLFLCLIYTHATNDIIITPLDYSGYPILCYLVLELQDSFCQGSETDNFN